MITILNETPKLNTATENIECYKWLYLLDNIPISPNRLFCFEKGKTYMTFLQTSEYKCGDRMHKIATYGFHSYKTREAALRDLSNRQKTSCIQKLRLFRCLIPASSNYYVGATSESGEQSVLVSNMIIISEQVSDEMLKVS